VIINTKTVDVDPGELNSPRTSCRIPSAIAAGVQKETGESEGIDSMRPSTSQLDSCMPHQGCLLQVIGVYCESMWMIPVQDGTVKVEEEDVVRKSELLVLKMM
jgi:hypothetical protein